MKVHNADLLYSPSDLITYLDSPYASWMDRFCLEYPDQCPVKNAEDELNQLLVKMGYEHEAKVLADFKSRGLNVIDIAESTRSTSDKITATIAAMQSGVDVIFQGVLNLAPFQGVSDFLVKVPGQSLLGNYHYQVWDSKLSKSLKPYYSIQLCCYQEMLRKIQGCYAEQFVLVLGNSQHEYLKTNDYFAFYQYIKQQFLQLQQQFDPTQQPDPEQFTRWGKWSDHAETVLQARDYLGQVANIRQTQIEKLKAVGINTLSALATSQIEKVPQLSASIYARLKQQAVMQLASKNSGKTAYQIIVNPDQNIGLAALPPHSNLDVFFDIEGFPLLDGGLEYLWGNTYFDEQGYRQFKDFWAHDTEQEQQAFCAYIQWVYARWQADPNMHIYHYASYEISACRKLMNRSGQCEYEFDELLRQGVFVDLYRIVKDSIVLGEPKYSIKNVEHLYRTQRNTTVGNGTDSVVAYQLWRQKPDGADWQNSKTLSDIRDYNIDDCNSTQELVDWLRNQQQRNDIVYKEPQNLILVKPLTEKKVQNRAEKSEHQAEVLALRERLLTASTQLRMPLKTFDQADTKTEDPSANASEKQARLYENLAWALEFHRREHKVQYWRRFDRFNTPADELLDDAECLVDLQRATEIAEFMPKKGNTCYAYRLNNSEQAKSVKFDRYFLHSRCISNDVESVNILRDANFEQNLDQGILWLKCKSAVADQLTLIPDDIVNADVIAKAIFTVAKEFVADPQTDRAVFQLLRREYPRVKGIQTGENFISSAVPALHEIVQVISQLDQSYMVIQGPPGTGKSYTAKHVIAALLKEGKKIAISSNSHAAINHLLANTADFCKAENIQAQFYCNKPTRQMQTNLGISEIKNDQINAIKGMAYVVGTTAWGLSRNDVAQQFDYLFVDEAGQVALANLIAMSQAAHNIVLMGDQMQLSQPIQGSHPADIGLSVLDYLLGDVATVAANRGLFLAQSYRMHSAINAFISTAFYEGRLSSAPNNDSRFIQAQSQALSSKNTIQSTKAIAGLKLKWVAHSSNLQSSVEEVNAIVEIVAQLKTMQVVDQTVRNITLDDMLFVAPYNAQVELLKRALGPAAKVGSVDKFQGQEAAIVFYSLCSSDASQSSRGMEFVFDPQRLNVAISRAQIMAIVVANPALIQCETNSLTQQRLINRFCQLVSIAEPI